MLYAIEKVHDMGYIHRDIKPSNFVMGKKPNNHMVYIVDFGLCKQHLNSKGVPVDQRRTADFRGTVAYASLNAHNKIVLDCVRVGSVQKRRFVELVLRCVGLPQRRARVAHTQE
eukprot:TRINITY_DN1253_c0_g1_i2.p2 TRINITY_DN1253_c0_g1~~TRINITY_DN1253_c0_g1_i2.p2  ORF type:complete len:114 (+),score=3.96 TRINITY_DN1253_c0_g1_i2:601-942(+)